MEANRTEELRLTVEPGVRTMVVRMEGPLLLHTATQVRERLHDLEERQPGCLIADLREVTDIDSTGLAVLLWMHRTQVNHRSEMIVVSARPMLDRIFEVTRLCDVFDVRREMPEPVS
jgi:anti-anti-sigma factor